jgi:hypothetical protein
MKFNSDAVDALPAHSIPPEIVQSFVVDAKVHDRGVNDASDALQINESLQMPGGSVDSEQTALTGTV